MRSRNARLFHVDSPRVKEDLRRCYRIDPGRIAVVPHAVDVGLFSPAVDKAAVRRALGLPEDETILLFCGHDFMRKGLDRAIDALAGMNEPARLVVVGKRDRTLFETRAARLGVSSRVHFVGERSDPHLFHQAADILVLPSRFELWGIPVIEAMAVGVPPVVAGAVGAAEAVSAAQAGLVLNEPFSAAELASALDRLAGSPALRRELGERGTRAASAYSWEAIGARVLSDIVAVAGEISSSTSP